MSTQTEDSEASPAPSPRRARLDRRTLVVCVVVALVVAIISAAVAAVVMGGHDDRPQVGLATAHTVPADLKFTRFDGSTGTLADYRGQKLVVNYFSSTCVPCRKEMPTLEKLQRSLGEKITVIGLAVQDDGKDAQALVRRTGATYDTAQDFSGAIYQHTGGTGLLPFTIFVDADGTIVDKHYGPMTGPQVRQKVSDTLLAGG